jgi:hypothetical protein
MQFFEGPGTPMKIFPNESTMPCVTCVTQRAAPVKGPRPDFIRPRHSRTSDQVTPIVLGTDGTNREQLS